MALTKLSKHEIAANPEYLKFLRSLKAGEGGRALVSEEGVSKPTLKQQLNTAAQAAGVTIKFHRSPKDEVIFQVVEPGQS